jgi:chromate transporter
VRAPSPTAGLPDRPAPGERPSLGAILRTFAYIGSTSFGGGISAYLRDALVVRRRWLTDQDYLEGRELSQIMPGPNPINLSVYLAQRVRGWPGALVAVLGAIGPGVIFILALGALYFRHGELPSVSAIFNGIAAAAVGLTLATTLQVGEKELKDRRGMVLIVLTFVSVAILHVPMPIALLVFAPISIWLHRPPPMAPPSAEAPEPPE